MQVHRRAQLFALKAIQLGKLLNNIFQYFGGHFDTIKSTFCSDIFLRLHL